VTIAKRPFVWAGMARDQQVICPKRQWKYFFEGYWTPDSQKAGGQITRPKASYSRPR
jgi:hypothetical protein